MESYNKSLTLSTVQCSITAGAGSTAGTNLDASWWFKFTNDGNTYTVQYRKMDYIFESEGQNKFHYDVQEKIYDYKTGKSVKDTVKILKTNTIVSTGNSIGYPITWQVVDTVTEADGFQDNRKVKIGFFDDDDDGVVDNPEIFDIFVEPDTSESTNSCSLRNTYLMTLLRDTDPMPQQIL